MNLIEEVRLLNEVFPEMKPVLPMKIKEWQGVVDEFKPLMKQIAKLKGIKRVFWKRALTLNKRLTNALSQMERLGSLRRLTTKTKEKDKFMDFELAKEKALAFPVMETYRFDRLKKVGKNYTCLCPLHQEKTPSFYIYPETNSFYCFACHKGGDVIKFIRELKQCTFKEAVETLSGGN